MFADRPYLYVMWKKAMREYGNIRTPDPNYQKLW
jgi:hypothetical protein